MSPFWSFRVVVTAAVVITACGHNLTSSTGQAGRTQNRLSPRLTQALNVMGRMMPHLQDGIKRLLAPDDPVQTKRRIQATNGIAGMFDQLTNGGNTSLGGALQALENGGILTADQVTNIQNLDLATLQSMVTSEPATAKCLMDVSTVLSSVGDFSQMWALEMLDASGKPGPSILQGNTLFMGNYRQCADIKRPRFSGNICRLGVIFDSLSIDFGSIEYSPPVKFDLCVPDSCHDLELKSVLSSLNFTDVTVMCSDTAISVSDDSNAKAAIAVLSIFAFFVFLGTIMEIYVQLSHSTSNQSLPIATVNGMIPWPNKSGESKEVQKKPITDGTEDLALWQKCLLAFSLPRNSGRLFSVEPAKNNIGCLHGIRVLSLAWVILGHVIMTEGAVAMFNKVDFMKLQVTWHFQMIINAPLSVDTFFFMSAFLTAYLFLKEFGKSQSVAGKKMGLYYFHRYWRLTPAIMIAVMVEACLLIYAGLGRPGWTKDMSLDPTTPPIGQGCQKTWWHTLLYIQTLTDEGMGCLGQSWYVSLDMMYYILAPLVLIPWVYNTRTSNIIGFIMAIIMIGVHIGSNLWLINKYNFDLFRNQAEYSTKLYFKPWSRSAPYAIGLIFGWVMYKTKGQIKMRRSTAVLGWLVAIGMSALVVFVTYDENSSFEKMAEGWPKAGRMIHETFYRPVWALVIGWIVLACVSGHGGFINAILSWSGWLPLSRLSFACYLIHGWPFTVEVYALEFPRMYTMDLFIYRFLGYYVVSHILAYLMVIFVEAPLLGLEKILLR